VPPGAIDAHARTRDERRGGRVEVGLPRVAEDANRQRMKGGGGGAISKGENDDYKTQKPFFWGKFDAIACKGVMIQVGLDRGTKVPTTRLADRRSTSATSAQLINRYPHNCY